VHHDEEETHPNLWSRRTLEAETPVASEAQRLRNEAAAQERAAQYDVTATCGLSYTYSSQATHRRSKHCDDVLELKTQERYDLLRQRR